MTTKTAINNYKELQSEVENLREQVAKLEKAQKKTSSRASDFLDDLVQLKNNYVNFSEQVAKKFDFFEDMFRSAQKSAGSKRTASN